MKSKANQLCLLQSPFTLIAKTPTLSPKQVLQKYKHKTLDQTSVSIRYYLLTEYKCLIR